MRMQNISLFISVCLFLLLMMQGVESNPGPGTGSGASSNPRGGSRGSHHHQVIRETLEIRLVLGVVEGRGGRRDSYVDSAFRGSDRVLRSSESNTGMRSSWLISDCKLSNGAARMHSESDMARSRPGSSLFTAGMSDYELDNKSVLYEIREVVKSTRSDIQETNQKFDRLEQCVNDLRSSHED